MYYGVRFQLRGCTLSIKEFYDSRLKIIIIWRKKISFSFNFSKGIEPMPPMARAKKRPVVLELGQLEGRLQSPRLTGAGEPTVGSARARARAKYKVEHVLNQNST